MNVQSIALFVALSLIMLMLVTSAALPPEIAPDLFDFSIENATGQPVY